MYGEYKFGMFPQRSINYLGACAIDNEQAGLLYLCWFLCIVSITQRDLKWWCCDCMMCAAIVCVYMQYKCDST